MLHNPPLDKKKKNHTHTHINMYGKVGRKEERYFEYWVTLSFWLHSFKKKPNTQTTENIQFIKADLQFPG